MQRVKKVKALRNYLLVLEFSNGEKRVFNCYPLLEQKIYSELKNPEFFNTVHIDEMGVVCWNEYTDIDPFLLYEESEPIANIAT